MSVDVATHSCEYVFSDDDTVIWKWWMLRDNVTEIHSASALSQENSCFDLPRPSVRYLKTVNTKDEQETEMAVNAQHYCVLLTNCPMMDVTVNERDVTSTEDHAWYLKAFYWFFREISVETVHLKSHFTRTMSKIGLIPSRSTEGQDATSSKTEIKKRDWLSPQAKKNSWNRLQNLFNAGMLIDAETSAVSESFRSLFPEDFVMAHPIRNHKKLDRLISKWDRRMTILERYEEYANRTQKRKLLSQSKWWSFLFFYKLGYHPPVDAILHYTVLVRQLEREIAALRKKILSGPHSSSWLIFFRTQSAAAIASQALLHSERLDACRVEPAPGPDEINWQALWTSEKEKNIRGLIVAPLLFILIGLPLGIFAGALSSLNKLLCSHDDHDAHHFEWYCKDGTYQNFLEGWLPSILVSLWQNMIMPHALYYLVQASAKCVSLSQLERSIAELFFIWDVVNIFLGGMLGGSVVSKLHETVNHPERLMHILGEALPASSNLFVNYVTLRAFFLVPYQLLVPHAGIWYYLMRFGGRCGFARTARDRTALWAPSSVRYGREYGLLLLIFLISLGYSVISPVILPIALMYFMMSWIVWRYQILYIFVRKYESGGRMWPVVVNRLVFCLWLFQFLTSCVLLTKEAYYQAAILWVTVPFILRRFYVYCDNRFEPGLNYIPLEMAHDAPPAEIDPKVYTPPALLEHCAGWHPEYMKAWEGWAAPGYTI